MLADASGDNTGGSDTMTTIKGLERVSKKLNGLANFTMWATPPMQQTVALVHEEIAQYKPKAQGAFSRYATPAQRRAYWAKVRSGEARHQEGIGYVRSGTLGRKWVTKVKNTTGGVQGEIGNNAEYARYVQSAAQQQTFHKATGFATDVSAMRATEQGRRRIWQASIRRELSR
jgi:hypothetical protein